MEGKPGLGEAKQLLRCRGGDGPGLAARLSRLSRVRGGQCHPEEGIVEDIRAFLGKDGANNGRKKELDEGDGASTAGT
eukprot:14219436-Alexandrium_andersonii.AAC.1